MNDKFKIPYINAVIRAFAKHFSLDIQSAFHYLWNFKGISSSMIIMTLSICSPLTML